jgi:hypothetical protein
VNPNPLPDKPHQAVMTIPAMEKDNRLHLTLFEALF